MPNVAKLVVAAVLLVPCVARADDPPAPPPACTDPAYAGFDFWLGEWVVIGAKDRPAGHSRITKILGGCAVLEEWFGFAQHGISLNSYDPQARLWRQSWVDAKGTVLNLVGGADADRMVLRGESAAVGSAPPTRHEIEWTRTGPDEVRQVWRQAKGAGELATVFDGRYTRAPKKLELASHCGPPD